MKILVIEDEQHLNKVVTKFLKSKLYAVDSAFNGEDALGYIGVGGYDVIILDVMMPKMDGYEFLKKIREMKEDVPVIMLTAKDQLDDKIKAFELGADDYLIKPFELEELNLRIKAIIKRKYNSIDEEISIQDLTLNLTKKLVTRAGTDIELTAKEYALFEYLMINMGRIISRDQLIYHVWNYEYDGVSNIVDVLIKNIRKKIDIGNKNQIIFTKKGLGYVVKNEV